MTPLAHAYHTMRAADASAIAARQAVERGHRRRVAELVEIERLIVSGAATNAMLRRAVELRAVLAVSP